jgi:hypothetical protein
MKKMILFALFILGSSLTLASAAKDRGEQGHRTFEKKYTYE